MRSGQNISDYTTAKPPVHVWNHDLIWWQNKIDTQKTFPQDYDYELLNLSKTKIPITIVKDNNIKLNDSSFIYSDRLR